MEQKAATEKATYSSASDICWRGDEAHSRRQLWRSILQEAYEMACPWRNPYAETSNGGPVPMSNLFDSTAINSTFRTANRLLTDLVPPDQSWVEIKPGPVLSMRLSTAQAAELEKVLYQIQQIIVMVFKSEKFINSIWEAFLDMLVSGLGAMLVLENPHSDTEPLIFMAASQAEISIEDGPDGSTSGIFRRPKVKPRDIKRMWANAKLNDELRELLKDSKKANKPVELLEVTELDTQSQKWTYRVFYRKKGDDPYELVKQVHDTCPWILFPWSKIPGCEYGPGPVLLSLSDMRTANKVVEFQLKNAALALAGMYLVQDDGVINPDNIQIIPGGMIPVKSTGGSMGASMSPLPVGREFDLSQFILADLRSGIRQALSDQSLPPADGTRRSATEIIERMRMLTQDFGGAVGRLTSALVALVRRVADVLGRRGMIPKVKIDNFALRVQINSPLAQAQQLQQVEKVVRWIEVCRAIGGPQLTELVAKLEDILVWIGGQIGVPNNLIRDATERTAERERLEKIAAMQAAAGMGGGQKAEGMALQAA
ncbi:MAG: portal protein [Alphaproteobacteria bacterium]|nr:portal protein [Alphaproteobacteria bacterium]